MDTGVERFLDAAVLLVPLFFVTRVLVLAAPRRGRTVSRWALAVGIPAIVLLGLAGAAFLDEWPHELEAVALTGVMISILIAPVWVVALLARLVRWAWRGGTPPPPPSATPRVPEPLRLAVATVALGAGIALVQISSYRDESRAEARRQENLRKTINALEVTQRKEAEFDREVAMLQAKMTVLYKIMPEQLDPAAFMDRYGRLCQEHGLTLRSWRTVQVTGDPFQRADIDVVLEGPREALPALAERTRRLARLADWSVGSVTEDEILARLSIFALPPRAIAPSGDACTAKDHGRVWLWPLRGRMRTAYRERARLCDDLRGYAAIREKVDALEVVRTRFQERIDLIERLRSGRKPIMTVPADAPPAEEEEEPPPSPDAAPVPKKKA